MRSAQAFGSVWRITPVWLRPCAIGLVVLVHAAVIFGVPWQKPDELAVPVTLQIDVVAGGEPANAKQEVDQKQSDEQVGEVKPVETQPAETKTAADVPQETVEAKPVQETTPSPPRTVESLPSPPDTKPSATTEPLPPDNDRQGTLAMVPPTVEPEEPHPDAPPAAQHPQQIPPDARAIQRQEKRKEQAEKRNERTDTAKHAPAAAPARVASRAGTDTGHGETGTASGAISTAEYSSLVNAEIRRNSHYPEAASPATGTVVLSFTIGPSGRVTSNSIIQSSGHGLLDSAARQTLSALSLPPPPGGRFSRTVPLHYRPQ
jgi:periplasmic protein TonB